MNLTPLDVGFDMSHRVDLWRMFESVQRFLCPRRQPLPEVEATMSGQPVKPRAEARFTAKLPGLLPGAQKNFLRQLLGGFAAPGHGPCQPVGSRVITLVQLREHL